MAEATYDGTKVPNMTMVGELTDELKTYADKAAEAVKEEVETGNLEELVLSDTDWAAFMQEKFGTGESAGDDSSEEGGTD